MRRLRQRGLTLVECAAALALASLAVAATGSVNQAASSLLRRTRSLAETTDLARNLLEHELGAPCAASFACPPGYRCSVSRVAIRAGADHVTAVAIRGDEAATGDNDEISEELSTLAPPPAC